MTAAILTGPPERLHLTPATTRSVLEPKDKTIEFQEELTPMTDVSSNTLYGRLGGYDAIAAVADNLLPRLMSDDQLGRFWEHRGEDGIQREKQLLVDFLCHNAGGPLYYTGRDMTTSHRGMRISDSDWQRFIGHLELTLAHFQLGEAEQNDVLAFIQSTKAEIVEA